MNCDDKANDKALRKTRFMKGSNDDRIRNRFALSFFSTHILLV